MIKKNILLLIFVFAFIFRFILSFMTWHIDVFNHVDWGTRFWEYGPKYFYEANVWNFTWPNQPPGTIYIFAIIRKLYEFVFQIFWWLNVNFPLFPSGIITYFESNLYPAMLKLPAILADLGIAYLIYKLLQNKGKEKSAVLGASLFLFNPVIWYNSAIWGQTDAIINFLTLLAFYLLLKKKLVYAVLFLSLSIYIKASLLIFVPIFFIYAFKQKYKFTSWIMAFLFSLSVIILLTIPFADTNPFVWLFELYQIKVFTQQMQVITANAFNLWAFITGIHEQPHTMLLGPISYKMWGFVLFTISIIPALWILIKNHNEKTLFWSLALMAFSSFMLLTNMHERYLYPLFPVLTILVVKNKKLMPVYIFVSLINLLNLYNLWWYPNIDFIINLLSVGDRFFPRVLGLINFCTFLYFFVWFLRQNKLAKL